MSRVAADGLILVNEKDGNISIIEINSETTLLQKTRILFLFVKKYQI